MTKTETKTNMIEEAITEYLGERCPEHVSGCPICDAWAQFDRLASKPA